ncbi:MAG TPA: vitamin B12-dependent ribonucleotide reductase [bacterium]|nr:vitamin B12-dependent ribonucleotide reductase [bacterium]
MSEKDQDKDQFFDEPEFAISENARRVLERRYLKKDYNGNPIEKPQNMFRRVARVIAQIDRIYDPDADVKALEDEFYQMMTAFEFVPNSPTLMNAGRELGQLSACFVIPVDDSLDSIFEAVKHTAMIHKSGGGTGFSFSRLRPKNDVVNTTRGVASGPISFMRVFDSATEEIKQGGTRRGANMGILNVDHPDIEDFIVCKQDTTKLTNFNISVGLTEEFMRAVEDDAEYDLHSPRTHEPVSKLPAQKVWKEIVDAAWKTGEPGIVFLDRLNADNPTPNQGRIESTNPCGEQPLLPYESCNLGSINLAKVVSSGKINWDKLAQVVNTSVHFLDNVIDANKYPLPQIEETTKKNRKIGLGIMGWADMLVQLGIPYNSSEATQLAEDVMLFIRDEGRKESAALAEKRGPFPAFEGSIYDEPGQPPLRNATVTTIAPTGTISIIAGASSGVEPYFAISYVRTCMDNDELAEVNPYFEAIAREQGFYSEALMKKVAKKGSLRDLDEIPEDVRKLFVTAMDITPDWHVRMQAAFQKYTDNAVSKTVNFQKDATPDEIAKVYEMAYRLGCKGVTVYRDGSRENQVLSVDKQEDVETEHARGELKPRPRMDMVQGRTRKMPTGCGSLYVTINEDEHGLFEVFTNMGKAGGCAASQAEAVSRLISLALRAGMKAEEIVRQLKGISCPQMTWWENGKKIHSCADAIAKAIETYPSYKKNGSKKIGETEPAGAVNARTEPQHTQITPPDADPQVTVSIAMCPDCGGPVEYKEGCMTCQLCGFTKC